MPNRKKTKPAHFDRPPTKKEIREIRTQIVDRRYTAFLTKFDFSGPSNPLKEFTEIRRFGKLLAKKTFEQELYLLFSKHFNPKSDAFKRNFRDLLKKYTFRPYEISKIMKRLY